MATQSENWPPARSAENIGNAFAEQYYQFLLHSPEQVYRFYGDTSILSRPDLNGRMRTVTTKNRINDEICNLDYKNYKAEIKSADSQNSFKKGVMVLVTGCLIGKDDMERKFVQTFFLAPQETGYYVLNDVLRYVEEITSDGLSEVATVTDDTPSSALTQDPEPAQVIDPPKEENITYAAGIKIAEEKENDQVIEERAASHPREIVVAAESLEDSPNRSYASIATAQTKKGPTKVYVPPTARVASTKTEKQSVIPVAEASVSEACATVNAPEIDYAQDEVEGHSIYIRDLPLDVTVAQLEAEFAKFGPIKQNGVHVCSKELQGFCFGFIDFQEFSSVQSAIKASPITIGYLKATVEISRTTARVGSGRGRFSSPRGGFRNENFRGRGNFSGGRTYMRSGSIRGRGNFSSGWGGEGYHQQGRGRGSPRPNPNQM
ncbi:nuclear transport factor 2-like isoform X1 [Salvia splendens]|uniref:nuclear transport factor 2-like isoform X1 n=2 Tax=Salvia splendens TaxID=180675 RepID=UPI001C27344B|nr:nuclear transport factor 2-like isoform X1 [Salvia splendens]